MFIDTYVHPIERLLTKNYFGQYGESSNIFKDLIISHDVYTIITTLKISEC